MKIKQLSIAVIWGEIEMGEKVTAQNTLIDICHGELELELLMPNLNFLYGCSITLDEGAVGSLKTDTVGALKLLRVGRGYD